MIKNTLTITVALGLSMSGVPALAESAFEQEAKDRAEIEKLMWQYARALDTENADVYVATYTPDGHFGGGANATKGHDALHKYTLRAYAEAVRGMSTVRTRWARRVAASAYSPPLRLYGGCRLGVCAHLPEPLASSPELASQG